MPLDDKTLEIISGNPNFNDKQLLREISELFFERPLAVEFLYLFGQYAEVVDDVVDEEKDVDRIQKMTELAAKISIHPYWTQYKGILYWIERLINNQCFDSVRWEKAEEEWKRRDARCLSHASYNMLFAVILIEFGEETLKAISLRFREHAHLRHLHDTV